MWVHALEFERADVFDVSGLTRTEKCNDDCKAYGDFSRRNRDNKENEDLCVVIGKAFGAHIEAAESYKRQIRRVEHELQAHENGEDVSAQQHSSEADGEEEATGEKIVVEGKAHGISRDGWFTSTPCGKG